MNQRPKTHSFFMNPILQLDTVVSKTSKCLTMCPATENTPVRIGLSINSDWYQGIKPATYFQMTDLRHLPTRERYTP